MADKVSILERMKRDAEANGYYLCPDEELLEDLIDGLATNEDRYGYGSCPCRMASGIKDYDSDIICPCEYRDADVDEFGMCYCSLFVSKAAKNDPTAIGPIPERRPVEAQEASRATREKKAGSGQVLGEPIPVKVAVSTTDSKKMDVWRCTVCGYLCAREHPPPVCPICKAKAEKFERFSFG